MKRFLLLFTATLALFTFVACSDDDDDSPASSGNGNTTSTTNGTGDNSSTTGSSVADSLIGNTYKDMRSGPTKMISGSSRAQLSCIGALLSTSTK